MFMRECKRLSQIATDSGPDAHTSALACYAELRVLRTAREAPLRSRGAAPAFHAWIEHFDVMQVPLRRFDP